RRPGFAGTVADWAASAAIAAHLGGIGDVWISLEENKDFATAERLGLEFGEDFRLLADIGWRPDENRVDFELTMPPHDLMEVLRRLHDEAEKAAYRIARRAGIARGRRG